jgi:hypothetical protein
LISTEEKSPTIKIDDTNLRLIESVSDILVDLKYKVEGLGVIDEKLDSALSRAISKRKSTLAFLIALFVVEIVLSLIK